MQLQHSQASEDAGGGLRESEIGLSVYASRVLSVSFSPY